MRTWHLLSRRSSPQLPKCATTHSHAHRQRYILSITISPCPSRAQPPSFSYSLAVSLSCCLDIAPVRSITCYTTSNSLACSRSRPLMCLCWDLCLCRSRRKIFSRASKSSHSSHCQWWKVLARLFTSISMFGVHWCCFDIKKVVVVCRVPSCTAWPLRRFFTCVWVAETSPITPNAPMPICNIRRCPRICVSVCDCMYLRGTNLQRSSPKRRRRS